MMNTFEESKSAWDTSDPDRDYEFLMPDSNKYRFDQLFDVDEVQKIQDAFSKATGVASIITEIDGTPITKPSGFSYFCNEIIRKTEKGCSNCMKSDAILGSPHPDGPKIQKCLSGGLFDGGTSIMVGNHHAANWLIGQVLDEDADFEEIYKYCDEIGADFDEFDAALQKVIRMPLEQFVNICNFLYLNANILSSHAMKNIVQQEEIRKRIQTEEKYRLLFENAVEAIIVVQDEVIKICNPAAVELTGFLADELLSLPVTSFIHPDDRNFVYKKRAKAKKWEKEDGRYHLRILKKDNTFRWAEMNIIQIKWEGKPATLNFIADITVRKQAEDALILSEEKYRLLTEFASDVIWVLNPAKKMYTYISPSVYQQRGFTVEEALKESLEESLAPESLQDVDRFIKRGIMDLVSDPQNTKSYVNEIQQPCKNGDVIWIEVSTRFRYNFAGEIEVVGVSRDIEKRKKAEAEIMYLSYKDQLTGLANRRFYEEELKKIDISNNLPLTLIMVDVNGLKLTNDAFGHKIGDILLMKVADILRKACSDRDTAARIGGDEFVLLLPKCGTLKAESLIEKINQVIAGERLDRIILSVSIGFAVKTEFSDDINEIFMKAEDNMYKNKLYEGSSMRSKTIDLIMNTLYEKNHREMLHSKRVSQICESIANEMDFDKDDINQIRLAGLMHDIGKIGIDEQILNKPGKLSSMEWGEIHRHSEIGYRILSSVNEFSEIAEYVLAHHERWDGRGYPKGLKEEQIPLKARIITLADSFDAMTSDRTYQTGLSLDEAASEIIKCSGTQFDPGIARIFVDKVLGKTWEQTEQ